MKRLFLIIALLCCWSCSSDGGGAEGTGGTITKREILGPVSETKNLGELTPSEEEIVCNNIRNTVREFNGIQTACRVDTISFLTDAVMTYLPNETLGTDTPTLQDQCSRATNACLAANPSNAEYCDNPPSEEEDSPVVPAGCVIDQARSIGCNVESGIIAECTADVLNALIEDSDKQQCSTVILDPITGFPGQTPLGTEPPPFESRACDELFAKCNRIGIGITRCDAFMDDY